MAKSWMPSSTVMGPIDYGVDRSTELMVTGGTRGVRRVPEVEGETPHHGANAFLEGPDMSRIGLWVNSLDSNFEMSGSTAQSRQLREFYPHNISQPSLTIGGQTNSSRNYLRVAEFIRSLQQQALNQSEGTAGGPSGQALATFVLLTSEDSFNWNQLSFNQTRNVTKGDHNGIVIHGYVRNIQAGAERFIQAPDYQFDFIVAKADKFLGLDDNWARVVQLQSIMKALPSLHSQDGSGFVFETGDGSNSGGGNGSNGSDGKTGNGGTNQDVADFW